MQRLRSPVVPGYKITILPSSGYARDVSFLFSHSPRLKFLRRAPSEGMLIDLIDKSFNYYLSRFADTFKHLRHIVRVTQPSAIRCVGQSKGGFGALAHAAYLAASFPDLPVRVLAFSPQTRLWPPNDRLRFSSYRRLLERADQDVTLGAELKRFGDPSPRLAKLANLQGVVVYGAGNDVDAQEAAQLMLRVPRLKFMPLPISHHFSLLPFVVDTGAPDRVAATLVRTFARDPQDLDLSGIAAVTEIDAAVAEFTALAPLGLSLKKLWEIDPAPAAQP